MNYKIFLIITASISMSISPCSQEKALTKKQKLATHEMLQAAFLTIPSDAKESYDHTPKPDLTFFVYEFAENGQEKAELVPVAGDHITFKFAQAVLENNIERAQDYAQQGANPNALVCTFPRQDLSSEDRWDACSMPLIFRAAMHEQVEMLKILANMPDCKLNDYLDSYREPVQKIGAFFDYGSMHYRSYIDCTLLQCLAENRLYIYNLKYKTRPHPKAYEPHENEQMAEILLQAGANPEKGDYWHEPFKLALKNNNSCALQILKYLKKVPCLDNKEKESLCKTAIDSLSPEHIKTLLDKNIAQDTSISQKASFVSFYGGGRMIESNNYISLLRYAEKWRSIWKQANREFERKRLHLIIKQLMRPYHLKYALTEKESMGLGNTAIYDTLLNQEMPDSLINVVLDYQPMSQEETKIAAENAMRID